MKHPAVRFKDVQRLQRLCAGVGVSLNDQESSTLVQYLELMLEANREINLTSVTDFNGLPTTLSYNASGFLTAITDPASRTFQLGQNTSGQLTSIKDADNAVMTYVYDTANDCLPSQNDCR